MNVVFPSSRLLFTCLLTAATFVGTVAHGEDQKPSAPSSGETAPPAEAQFKKRQSSIIALQPGGRTLGTAYKLTATALENRAKTEELLLSFKGPKDADFARTRVQMIMESEFFRTPEGTPPAKLKKEEVEQLVTEEFNNLSAALDGATAVLKRLRGPLPKGWTVEWMCENREFQPHLSSASLAAALTLDCMLTDSTLSERCGVAGYLFEDGTLGHVPWLPAMVRAAIEKKCEWVCVPKESFYILYTYALEKGPAAVAALSIFEAATFDEARAMTGGDMPEALRKAITLFEDIRIALPKQANQHVWLKHPKVIAKLQEVLAAAPNHAGAKVLHLIATGKPAQDPTLPASIEVVFDFVNQSRSARASEFGASQKIKEVVARFAAVKETLHPVAGLYATTALEFCKGSLELVGPGGDQARSGPKYEAHRLRRTAMNTQLFAFLDKPELFSFIVKKFFDY